jgi:hypothetical protein
VVGIVYAECPSGMENLFYPKKILKPDVPPPRASGYFRKPGWLVLIAIGLCLVAGAIAIGALLVW